MDRGHPGFALRFASLGHHFQVLALDENAMVDPSVLRPMDREGMN